MFTLSVELIAGGGLSGCENFDYSKAKVLSASAKARRMNLHERENLLSPVGVFNCLPGRASKGSGERLAAAVAE